MCSRKRIISLFILVFGCIGYQNILAATIYQWTDEAGNINFSDIPTTDPMATETHEFIIKDASVNNVDFEQYSIINQAELMAEWRRQLADERLAKKQLYLEEKRLQHERELSKREGGYATGYYGGGGYFNYPYQQYPHGQRHEASILPSPSHNGKAVNVPAPSVRNINSQCC